MSQNLAVVELGVADEKKESRKTSTNGIPIPNYVISSQIRSVNTQSTIEMIFNKRKKDADDTSASESPPDPNDLLEAILEHRGQQQKLWQDKSEKEQQTAEHTDARHLTEDDVEQVDVVILQDRKAVYDAEDDVKLRNHQEHFSQYTHHHFLLKWGYMGKKTDKNEEWWIEEPQVLAEDDPGFLCEMCRHINFEVLLTQKDLPGNSKPGLTLIELHGVDLMVKRTGCSFCRLITEKMKADGIVDLEDEEGLKFTDINLTVLEEEDEDSMLRLEVALISPTETWPTQRYIVQSFYGHSPKNGTFQALYVNPKRANGEWLKTHLGICQERHSQRDQADNQMDKLRVIDVEENKVTMVDLPCAYVCLSYVWGGVTQQMNTESTRELLMRRDGLLSDQSSIPKTITDAMEVTKTLEMRYLWVDALCIMQDDDADRQFYIGNMSSIYSQAQVTIVAPNNSNPYEGLPGVTDVVRKREQIVEVIQGIPMTVAFQDIRAPLADVELATWNTRAWTYQERHLSQRLAMFTDSQIIFACHHSVYFEDTTLPVSEESRYKPIPRELEQNTLISLQGQILFDVKQAKHINKSFVTDIGISTFVCQHDIDLSKGMPDIEAPIYKIEPVKKEEVSGFLKLHFENIWNVYANAVVSYTSRRLTNAGDIVPAFQGLCNWIRQGADVEFHSNLPGYAFIQALLWYPKEKLERRKHNGKKLHPTWTWAGWEGRVKYRGRRWRNAVYRGHVSAIQWLRRLDPQVFFDEFGQTFADSQKISLDEAREKIMAPDMTFLVGTNYGEINMFNYEDSGWKCVMDKKRNQHAFVQQEKFALSTGGPVVFPYPVPIPGQANHARPDKMGRLDFRAFSAPAHFCHMTSVGFVDHLGTDQFLQIGLGDEDQSQGVRPSWKRIIYHQGYRAGFLVLNTPFEELEVENKGIFYLVALSRDELPDIAPPAQGEDVYHAFDPVELHKLIGWQAYGQRSEGDMIDATDPVYTGVKPMSHRQREDDDAHWDRGRFPDIPYPIYNLLLIQKNPSGPATRVGVGRMHMLALHCADAKFSHLTLC